MDCDAAGLGGAFWEWVSERVLKDQAGWGAKD